MKFISLIPLLSAFVFASVEKHDSKPDSQALAQCNGCMDLRPEHHGNCIQTLTFAQCSSLPHPTAWTVVNDLDLASAGCKDLSSSDFGAHINVDEANCKSINKPTAFVKQNPSFFGAFPGKAKNDGVQWAVVPGNLAPKNTAKTQVWSTLPGNKQTITTPTNVQWSVIPGNIAPSP